MKINRICFKCSKSHILKRLEVKMDQNGLPIFYDVSILLPVGFQSHVEVP